MLSLTHVWFFATQWTVAHQVSLSFTISQSLLKFISIELMMPSNISSSVAPLYDCTQSFPASGSFPVSRLFLSAGQSIGTSASIFQWIFRVDFFKDWLVWSPCSPRDSQESYLEPHFKSIITLAFSPLYGATLTSVHDCWKNYSFDNTNLCQQVFLICCLGLS